jgi:hypothetical protein
MKNLLAIAALALVATACGQQQDDSSAKGVPGSTLFPDQLVTIRTCRELVGPDHGLEIVIQAGGIAGRTMAKVSEQTIAGPRPVRTVFIEQQTAGLQETYTGPDFSLVIALESFAPTDRHSADLVMKIDGQEIARSITCFDVAE